MKNVYSFLIFLLSFLAGYCQTNNLCNLADPFCTGTTYNFPAGVNAGQGQAGPNYGCLYSQPNPAWYYMQVGNSGNITINMYSVPSEDIDFACWGPFTSPTAPCVAQLTATCTGCQNNTSSPPGYYPQGNLADCSYSTSWNETCHLPNAVSGQWYILLITNYSNQPCNIIFSQTAGPGTTNCGILAPPITNNGPLCVGDTLHLNVSQPTTGAFYSWTGPNGFTSNLMNPVVPNVTSSMAGIYTLTITVGSQTSPADSTTLVVNPAPTPSISTNSPICTGATLNLSASGGTSYLWSGPSGFSSTEQNPTLTSTTTSNSGTYSVTVTNSNSCTAAITSGVTIYPLPVPLASNNGPVCSGTTLNLNAQGGVSYSWTGPNSFSSTLQNPVITYLTTNNTGIYSVTVTDANSCTATTTTTAIVNSLPVPVAGNNSPICEGTVLNLTSSGANTYSWSGPGSYTSTQQNPTIIYSTTSNSGIYTVTVTDTHGCTATTTTTVTVKPLPTVPVVSSNTPICESSILSLSASSTPGASFFWSGPNGFTSSIQNPSIASATISNSGTYTVTATLNGCTNTPGSTTVSVMASPASTFTLQTPICQQDSSLIVYSGPSQPGTTYSWSFGGGTILSGYGPGPYYIQWPTPGTPTVTLTSTFIAAPYCSSTTSHQLTVVANSILGCCMTPTPNAGPNASICGLAYTFQGSLPGAGNTATWSKLSGPGTAVFSNSSSNVSSVSVSAQGQYVFQWNELSGQCTANSTVTISFVNQPVANAGQDKDTCGLTCSLHATPSYGSGHWSGNGSFSNPNSATTSVTSLQGYGIINFTWTENNTMWGISCIDVDTVSVHFYQIPMPSAGLTARTCGNTYILQGSLPAQGNTGDWSQVSGGGSSTFSDYHSNTSVVTVSTPGAYQFQWRESNGPCSASSVVNVTFIQVPTANAGYGGTICGKSFNLHALPSIGAGSWSGPGTFLPVNSPNSNVTVSGYGTYSFIWAEVNTVSGTSCTDMDSVKVTFMEIPVPDAGYDNFACGKTTHLLAISKYPGYWTGPAGALFYPSDSITTADVTIMPYYNQSHQATFYWHAVNGACTGTDSVKITFMAIPHAEAGIDTTTCDTVGYFLHADTLGSGATAGFWSSRIPGVLFNSISYLNPHITIANIIPAIYGDSSYVNAYFYWEVQNSASCKSRDSVKVTFYETPRANAGPDDSICGKEYTLNATLSMQESFGQWSVVSKPVTSAQVNFVSTGSPGSVVNVSNYGVYTFEWREWNQHNSLCDSRDTMQVIFLEIPNPDAGPDTSVCGKFVNLHAIVSPGDHGTWSSNPTGTSWWNQAHDTSGSNYATMPNTWARYSSQNDTVEFIWQEYNSICVARDSMHVYFASPQLAVPLVDPSDSTNCGLSFTRLNAQQPQYGTGYWIDTVPNTHYFPGPIPGPVNASPDSAVAAVYGMHHFHWVAHNGACRDTSAAVPVRYIQIPHANAGGHDWHGLYGSQIKTDTTCGTVYYLHAIPSYGSGTWSSQDASHTWFNQNGSGVQTSSRPNDTVNTTILTYNTNPPYRQLIWIEDNAGCTDADTLNLMFAPIPTANFTTTVPSCRGDSSVLIAKTDPYNAANYGIVHFYWSLDTTARYESDTTRFTDRDTVVARWTRNNIHLVSLITLNKFGCNSGIMTDTVREPAKFNPHYTVNAASCHLSNGEIILSNSYNTFQFTWDTSFASSTRHDTIQDNLQNRQYVVLVYGASLSPDAQPGTQCRDSVKIFVPDTGETTAMFDTTSFIDTTTTIAPYTTTFINESTGARNYTWIFYDKDGNKIWDSKDQNPVFTFQQGAYRIVLVTESRYSCLDTMTYKYLTIRPASMIEVPNVFSPNGDGVNDIFYILNKTLNEFHCIIFDRWGKKVYEWSDQSKGWDGKTTNGADAVSGVYFYVVTGKGEDNKDYEFKGSLELLRDK